MLVDNPYRILRASMLASTLVGAVLTLQMGRALAQGGMSDMKKMPGMNDMKMNDTKTATTANGRSCEAEDGRQGQFHPERIRRHLYGTIDQSDTLMASGKIAI